MNSLAAAFRDMLAIFEAGALIMIMFIAAFLAVGGTFLVVHLLVTP